jgi:ribonuclease HI
MKTVTIYSDVCKGNPGPGGWGAIIIFSDQVIEITGGAVATTNNQMQLTAAIEALRTLKEPHNCQLTIE